MKRKRTFALALVLALALVASLFSGFSAAEANDTTITQDMEDQHASMTIALDIEADPVVSYLEWNGSSYVPQSLEGVRYTTVDDSATAWDSGFRGGWYVVKDSVSISSSVTVSGDVKLVLCGDATLTAEKGITVQNGGSLTVYGQRGGDAKLELTGENAGISGAVITHGVAIDAAGSLTGAVTVNGGTVNAASISGGLTVNSGEVTSTGSIDGGLTVNGGTVNAGGIGGGLIVYDGEVTSTGASGKAGVTGNAEIHGGIVTATGGDNAAGIGGNEREDGGTVTITGGIVTATGGNNAAGIGAGYNRNGGTVNITGGTVIATGGEYAAGIGGGNNTEANGLSYPDYGKGGTVNITGGTVIASGGEGGVGIGGGGTNGNSGTLTVGNVLAVYGGSEPDPSDLQTDYASARWRYMIVQGASLAASTYLDSDGAEKQLPEDGYTTVTGSTTALTGGWYVVSSKAVTVDSAISVSGTVNLVLDDGVTLNARNGVTLTNGAVLNIYGQRRGTGTLRATGGAGISGGTVNVYGGTVNAAGINSTVNVYLGTVTATGTGVTGTLTVNGGTVTASGTNSAEVTGNVRVNGGVLTASGSTNGIEGTLTVGANRMVYGGANANSLNVISSTDRKPYMKVTESVYTIFYQDTGRNWEIPSCAYTYAGGSATEVMEQDGDYWRLTIAVKPESLTFFDAQMPETDSEAGGADSEPVPKAGETTGTQRNITISSVTGNTPPAATTIAGFGQFFVVQDGCRLVAFVDRNRTSIAVVQDGRAVTRPDDPTPNEGYRFLRWEQDGFDSSGNYVGRAFNFAKAIEKSVILYSVFEKESFTVSFDGRADNQTVKYGETAVKPANPANTATDTFKRWVLASTVNTIDANGRPLILPAGTAYDFSTPVTSNVPLKAEWLHTHVYTVKTYSQYLLDTRQNSVYGTTPALQINNSSHALACSCGDVRLESHTFDADGHCTKCGFDRANTDYIVRFFVTGDNGDTELSQYRTTRKAGGRVACPPYVSSNSNFVSYLVVDHETKKVLATETNYNKGVFTINCDTDIYYTHRERYSYPKTSVKLTTSAGKDGFANLVVSWNLSMGDVITGAGVLTTTNKELNKTNYSFWAKTSSLDTSNLLKNKDSDGSYDSSKRTNIQSHMISGISFDPNVKATIHDFPANNLSRVGSYTVPHQLPAGNTATSYGQWVYALGYVELIDASGNKHTYYTNPVAVSVSDPTHSVEYVYNY